MPATKSIMTLTQVKSRLVLARHLDYLCIVCGTPLMIVACMTYEHLRPRSLFKQGMPPTFNKAISHWRCNNLRGNVSLILADSLVKRKIEQITLRSDEAAAMRYINRRIPNVQFPVEALLPPREAWEALNMQVLPSHRRTF